MDNQPYMASRFAATFRRQIFRQHLGHIPPQDCDRTGQPDSAMRPVGVPVGPNEYDFGSEEDHLVADPLSDSFQRYWNECAATNSAVYAELWHPVPAQGIKNWEQYRTWVTSKKVGHIVNQDQFELRYIKEQLARIRGHLVAMPTDFLEDAGLLELTAEVNPLTLPSTCFVTAQRLSQADSRCNGSYCEQSTCEYCAEHGQTRCQQT